MGCSAGAQNEEPGLLAPLAQEAEDEKEDIETQKVGDKKAPGSRVIYIDWMRIMAIYLVLCFHVVQALDDYVGLFEGKGRAIPSCGYCESKDGPTQSRVLIENFQTYCLMVGMPVFFHISGRAQALSTKRKEIWEIIPLRVKRLFLPFLVAWALLIPPWLYMSWPPAPEEAQQSFWNFSKWYWSAEGFRDHGINTGWLWFLPALLVIDILGAPVLQFSERRNICKGTLAAVSVAVTFLVVYKCGLSWQFAFLSVLGPSFSMLLTFFIPFPDKQGEDKEALPVVRPILSRIMSCVSSVLPNFPQSFRGARNKWYQIFRWVAMRLSTGVQILTSVLMVRNFEYKKLSNTGFEMVPAFMLFYNFYIQGYFSERWSQGAKDLFVIDPKIEINGAEEKNDQSVVRVFKKVVRVYQIVAAMFLFVTLMSSAPAGRREKMLYPAYSASFEFIPGEGTNIGFGVCHVLGTWAWLTISLGLGQAYLNNEIQREIYKHASNSTTIVYIFHWMFLKGVCVLLFDKYNWKGSLLWKGVDITLLICVSVCGSLIIYWALLRCPKRLPIGKLFGL